VSPYRASPFQHHRFCHYAFVYSIKHFYTPLSGAPQNYFKSDLTHC